MWFMATLGRQSGIELLRGMAMFMILILHANYKSLGAPTLSDINYDIISSGLRMLIQALCCVSVNVFVLISGWFGMKPSAKGLGKLLFQCVFFLSGLYIVNIALGWSDFTIKGVVGCLGITSNYWFIRSYILLYILSPVLNSYVAKAKKQEFRLLLIMFFSFQTIYGWSGIEVFFQQGYSTISFIGLYLLSRYIKIYCAPFDIRNASMKFGLGYLSVSVLVVAIAIVAKYNGLPSNMFSYINPFIILSSVLLLLAFSQLHIESKLINSIGASCLSVYLFHHDANLMNIVYIPYVNRMYLLHDGIACLASIGIFLIVIYVLSIVCDQLRLYLWSHISRKLDLMAKSSWKVSRIWNYRSNIV